MSKKDAKQASGPRPEARLPKGLQDTPAAEIRATEAMLGTIRGVFERYGFEPLDTPAIEYTDALGKFLPDQDRPNEGVFSFQDDDEQWLSLRYDLTAPLARYVAENYQTLPKPFRRYQAGPVWRNEKPGPGRFRQFMQFDADTVGAESVAADAELCMLAADTLEALGVKRGDYVVKVNNRKVLDGVMESIGLGSESAASTRLTVLRAMDKYDRLGIDGVEALLGEGRKDDSGDYTKGAGLDKKQIAPILSLLEFGNIYDSIQRGESELERFPNPFIHPPATWHDERIAEKARSLQPVNPSNKRYDYSFGLDVLGEVSLLFEMNATLAEGICELVEMNEIFETVRFADEDVSIIIDPSVVRGLEYYTGPVFEAELTPSIVDERGQQIRLGSVVSGGRYDGLVERFTGEKVPATGVSVGVSRLLFGLQLLGKYKGDEVQGPVVVLVFDKDRMADYQKMVQELRAAGIRAELYLGSAGMKAQMKYADKRGSPCVVIQGGDEKARGEVQIKDLVLGAALTSIEDREEYLKKQAEAQFAVPEKDLVKAVRRVLDRHKS